MILLFFRGLTENFVRTHNLSSQANGYYQWQAFFILADVTFAVSGLRLISYEFLLITLIGFLLSTTLYLYVSEFSRRSGILAVLAFFISSFTFLNYQAAPFTVAFCLLFLLFVLDLQKKTANITIVMLVLFTALTLLHAFVPVFFLAYLLIRWLITGRDKKISSFLILLLTIYLWSKLSLASSHLQVTSPKYFVSKATIPLSLLLQSRLLQVKLTLQPNYF